MILLITIPLAILISLCWYLPCFKAPGIRHVLTNKDYWIIGLKFGFAYTCLLIMLTEIVWDATVGRFLPLQGLARDIFANFFRAALLEELFKFRGFFHAKKKYGLNRKIDYILIAGMMGLTYGLFEKVALANIAAVVVGLICPMHITWQLNQGGHYYEYEKAKAANDLQTAKRERMMALLVPFLFHGCWDSGLDIGGYLIGIETSTVAQVIGMIIMLGMVVFGIIYTVKTIKNVRRFAKETPAIAEPSDDPA